MMNLEQLEQENENFRLQIRDFQQSFVALAENLGLGDDIKKQFEHNEREIKEQFAPLTGALRQAYAQTQNPEYRAQHKRDCIVRYFPNILSTHIKHLMIITSRHDVIRVDNQLQALKQSGIQAIWPHIATNFTAEVKKTCGEVFSDEDVKLGAMQVVVAMQEIEEHIKLQKAQILPRKVPGDTAAFTGFRRGFLNSNSSRNSQPMNYQEEHFDIQSNNSKK